MNNPCCNNSSRPLYVRVVCVSSLGVSMSLVYKCLCKIRVRLMILE